MLDRLAYLVHAHARAIAIVAALTFVIAGALGAGVNQRLDPYDATDPATESAVAEQRLAAAGYFGTDVVVLVQGTDPRSGRVAAIARTGGAGSGRGPRGGLRLDASRATSSRATGARRSSPRN